MLQLIKKNFITQNLVNIDKIVISDKIKRIDEGFKYLIVYKDDNIVRSLCIFLPQMSGYLKYFDNDGTICLLKLNMITYW